MGASERCSVCLEDEDGAEKSLKSEILAMERVVRMLEPNMLLRYADALLRFCGDVEDMLASVKRASKFEAADERTESYSVRGETRCW